MTHFNWPQPLHTTDIPNWPEHTDRPTGSCCLQATPSCQPFCSTFYKAHQSVSLWGNLYTLTEAPGAHIVFFFFFYVSWPKVIILFPILLTRSRFKRSLCQCVRSLIAPVQYQRVKRNVFCLRIPPLNSLISTTYF